VVAGERAAAVFATGTEFDRLAGGVFKATMAAAGFRLHKRHEWRRARGVTPVLTFPDLLQYAPTALATALPPAPPPAARPGLIRPSSPEPEVQAILDRAARGDAAVLPAVRGLIRDRRFLDALGDVADVARERLVKLVAGDDVAVAEATRQKLAEVTTGLVADAGPRPTFAEGLAAGRAAHAWLTVHVIEAMAAKYPAGSPEAVAVEKHLGQAERRYQAALKALAVLRRLRGPVVVAAQVNVANGPMLVDNRGAAVGG
jgi:hypothetical protein